MAFAAELEACFGYAPEFGDAGLGEDAVGWYVRFGSCLRVEIMNSHVPVVV